MELGRRARRGPPEVGAGEVVLPPGTREPAVLAALLEDGRLAVVEELLDGLQSRRLEDEAGEDGVLAGLRRPRLDEEFVDDLALRRVGGQQVAPEALEDLVPRGEGGRVVLLCGNRPVSPTPSSRHNRN